MTIRPVPILLLFLSGCALPHPSVTGPAAGLDAAYRSAIEDAATIEPSEVHALRAVVGDSATVVTWTAYPASYSVGDVVRTTWGDVWVTLEGEVRDACAGFAPARLAERLEQLLGLPLGGRPRSFVVLRAARQDLFRPCGDPDLNALACGDSVPAAVPESHYAFYARQTAASYHFPGGFPWTRLGYTYDWGSGTGSEYGATELVIRRDAAVRVAAVQETGAYCSR